MFSDPQRPLKKKEIVVLLSGVVFIVVPFILAPLFLYDVAPNHPIINMLYGVWWKRLSFTGVGFYLAWTIGRWIDRREDKHSNPK
jgi:hypothetical protein